MDKALLFSCSIILHSRAGRSIYLAKEGCLIWWHECVHAAQALWVNEARIITFWTEKAVLGLDQTIYVECMMTSLVLDVETVLVVNSTEGRSNPAKPEDHFGPSASDKGPALSTTSSCHGGQDPHKDIHAPPRLFLFFH